MVAHRTKLTPAQLQQVLRELPRILTSRSASDPLQLRQVFGGNLAKELFDKVSTAYERKAQGLADDLGNKWKPLSPNTIARRPLAKGEISKYGVGGRGERAFKHRRRGLLTKSEDDKWKQIFVDRVRRLVHIIGKDAAEKKAAATAWAILKEEGAQTRKELLSRRKVLIMRNTDRLFKSWQPGSVSGSSYRAVTDQTYELGYGSVKIGSKVPYAKHASRERPVIPANYRPWVVHSTKEALRAVINHLLQFLP